MIGNGHAGFGRAASEKDRKGTSPTSYLARCHPGAIAREWTRERVREAMRAWRARYGCPPSSYDWSRSHASRRGPEALVRLQDAEWPPASTVSEVYGSWTAARADAFPDERLASGQRPSLRSVIETLISVVEHRARRSEGKPSRDPFGRRELYEVETETEATDESLCLVVRRRGYSERWKAGGRRRSSNADRSASIIRSKSGRLEPSSSR